MFVSMYLAGSNIEILNETNRDCFIKLWKDIKEAHWPSATTRSIDLWSKLMKIKYESGMLTMKEHLLNLEHFFGQFDRIKQPLSDLNKAAIMMSSVQESTEFDSLFAALLLAKEEDLNVKKIKEVLMSHETEFSLQERRHGRSQRFVKLKNGRREENLFSKHDYVENKNQLFSNSTTNMKIKIEVENAKTEWIVDSGANIHVTKTKQLLTDYHDSKGGFVIISDGINVPIEGYGTMEFTAVNSNNGESLTIMVKNVAYVPKFTVNLISVSKITMEHELEVVFSHNMCALVKDGKRFELAAIENSLYVHNLEAHESHAARVSPCIHHWHRVLAHRN